LDAAKCVVVCALALGGICPNLSGRLESRYSATLI
jgi:hypothetical protein